MSNRRYSLPQVAFFQGFEAAARNLSFTKAAEELLVTHGAVSRQVALLERAARENLGDEHRGRAFLADAVRRQVARPRPWWSC